MPDEPFIVRDRACLHCGYDLTSLRSDRECPECGTPVERSLRGRLLRYSAPEHVAKLHKGVLLAEIAAVGSAAVLMLTLASFVVVAVMGWSESIALAIGKPLELLVGIVSIVGWWLFSTPEASPLGEDPAIGARKLLRISMVVELAAALASFVLFLVFVDFRSAAMWTAPSATQLEDSLFIAGQCMWLLRFFTSLIYLRTVAIRFPDAKLYRTAKLFLWLAPLLTVFTCGIGLIVVYVMYIVMLERTRTILKAMRDGNSGAAAVA